MLNNLNVLIDENKHKYVNIDNLILFLTPFLLNTYYRNHLNDLKTRFIKSIMLTLKNYYLFTKVYDKICVLFW